MEFRSIGRALRHRNYRLFFGGQSISLIGSWLTRVATSWLVYRLTKSALTLGMVGFVGQLPTFLLAPVAGVLVDRWPRHRVLVVTQIAAMLQSAALAYFTLRGTIGVAHLLVLSAIQGLINAVDMPARQSFVVEMIEDRRDLPNAIALNSSMVNMARLIGPACAGALIAWVGEGGCFAIDAVSYVAVVASLVLMRVSGKTPSSRKTRIWDELSEGVRYASGFAPIRAILLLLSAISLLGMPYMILLPVIVTERLAGGPHLLGYLTASSGLGALLGVLYLASRQTVVGLGKVVAISSAGFGLALMGFAASKNPLLSIVLIFLTGMGMMVQMAASNTILQTLVDEDKRGRVMSLFTVAVVGMVPFGSLLSGILANRIGAPRTLFFCGVACVVGAAVFTRGLPKMREIVHPIYRKLGIIPEVATGLQEATAVLSPPEE